MLNQFFALTVDSERVYRAYRLSGKDGSNHHHLEIVELEFSSENKKVIHNQNGPVRIALGPRIIYYKGSEDVVLEDVPPGYWIWHSDSLVGLSTEWETILKWKLHLVLSENEGVTAQTLKEIGEDNPSFYVCSPDIFDSIENDVSAVEHYRKMKKAGLVDRHMIP